MARRMRSYRKNSSWKSRSTPYALPSYHRTISKKEGKQEKAPFTLERKDWKGATCPVCMEFPHNAVLLLCSSHDKGCRPYMCATSYRYSNCLDQFKKAYAKTTSMVENRIHDSSASKSDATELACPLCRGQVKGWTVVEPAREFLNTKRRSCTQNNCSFTGDFKELRKHVRVVHPCAKPHAIDPVDEQKWKNFEYQSERADVISTIQSSMPRSIIFGDYVIEMGNSDSDSDFSDYDDDSDDDDDEDDANGMIDRTNSRIIFSALLHRQRLSRNHVPEVRLGSSSGYLRTIINHASLSEEEGRDSGIVISERPRHHRRGHGRSRNGARLF